MLRRRELLLGMGVAALGACAPRLRDPAAPVASGTVPVGAAARWPPFALEGEEIVIARDNQPMVRLAPVSAGPKQSVGWVKGQVTMAPDFDAPLDDFMIDIDNHLSK
jgi:hypothetical protein